MIHVQDHFTAANVVSSGLQIKWFIRYVCTRARPKCNGMKYYIGKQRNALDDLYALGVEYESSFGGRWPA